MIFIYGYLELSRCVLSLFSTSTLSIFVSDINTFHIKTEGLKQTLGRIENIIKRLLMSLNLTYY